MQQVILNLVNNSLHALAKTEQEGRSLLLETREMPNGVRFAIQDSGGGFGSLNGEDLFSPFNGDRDGGIGMGLSICRRIIEAHGGSIKAEKVARGGARFVVDLPCQHQERVEGEG